MHEDLPTEDPGGGEDTPDNREEEKSSPGMGDGRGHPHGWVLGLEREDPSLKGEGLPLELEDLSLELEDKSLELGDMSPKLEDMSLELEDLISDLSKFIIFLPTMIININDIINMIFL